MNFYSSGGLGNLLFQHHAAYALARDKSLPLITQGIYPTAPDRPCIARYTRLFQHVHLVDTLPPPQFVEDAHDLRYRPIPDNVTCIKGYFQSWKYFKKYQHEIRDLLRSNEQNTWYTVRSKYMSIKGDKRTVCLHIRLGDNLENPIHCLQPESYYTDAMKKFPGQRFIAFSDSPEIAKTYECIKEHDVVFVDEDDPVAAFFMMSLCDDFIIPNSTLSLMAWHMRENTSDAIIHSTPNWHKNNAYITDMGDMLGTYPSLREILLEQGVPFSNGKIVIPEWVNSVKIDVGLRYDAPHIQNWITQNERCLVFGFEANKRAIDYMFATPEERQNICIDDYFMPPDHRWTCLDYSQIGKRCYILPVALDLVDEPQLKTFYIVKRTPTSGEDCCSLLRPVQEFCSDPETTQVMVYPLSHFMNLFPPDTIIDYIKTDVQGKDLDVIKSAGDFIRRVIYVTVEENTHQYEGSETNTLQVVAAYLQTKGFIHVQHPNTQDYTFLNGLFLDKANIYIWQKG
jgi:Glycosyl transferase family 11/Methyltransferase FkbM domain